MIFLSQSPDVLNFHLFKLKTFFASSTRLTVLSFLLLFFCIPTKALVFLFYYQIPAPESYTYRQ